eukprot:NODE_11553_length_221_cov_24.668605_g10812_i0.p2 GENE.NODE_11553_length_221_cov_24.668605_g10812_i0~~NODE_11553_length_221_cov_24.668605_g10812_i0.p2  ORF type:complete len:51 (-),score=6.09 NODE_11553_length_221_cov_24.668605_g10812_i0:34-186(-)
MWATKPFVLALLISTTIPYAKYFSKPSHSGTPRPVAASHPSVAGNPSVHL